MRLRSGGCHRSGPRSAARARQGQGLEEGALGDSGGGVGALPELVSPVGLEVGTDRREIRGAQAALRPPGSSAGQQPPQPQGGGGHGPGCLAPACRLQVPAPSAASTPSGSGGRGDIPASGPRLHC